MIALIKILYSDTRCLLKSDCQYCFLRIYYSIFHHIRFQSDILERLMTCSRSYGLFFLRVCSILIYKKQKKDEELIGQDMRSILHH